MWGVDFLMILVTLGTQDKSFERLLKAVDKEIKKGNIKEEVVVQAGYTNFSSSNMEIFDLVSPKKLEQLQKKARIIITHGGVGSILGSLKYDKPVIAAARLAKYGEHTNDHQLQIVEEFEKRKYLIALHDFDKLDQVLKKADTFKPRKYHSNNKAFIQLIDDYIEKDNNKSWWNKYKKIILVLIVVIILGFILVLV